MIEQADRVVIRARARTSSRPDARLLAERDARMVVNDLGACRVIVAKEINACGGMATAATESITDARLAQEMPDLAPAQWGLAWQVMAKMGRARMTQVLALEQAKRHIRVNCIASTAATPGENSLANEPGLQIEKAK